MVRLSRTACFGTCPVYTVTVHPDGTVIFEGGRFVKAKGRHRAHLSRAKLAALRRAIRHAGFFALHDDYTRRMRTDAPSATLTVRLGHRRKTVDHYYGDTTAPKALTALEDAVDRIVDTARWIGHR